MLSDQKSSPNIRYAMALVLLIVITAVARYDFLAFHLVAELISVIVSILVFVTAVGSYRFHRNNYLLILGGAYFWVAILDLAHALTYKGMGLFGVTSANTATQLWIAGRLLEAVSLAVAPFFLLRLRLLAPIKVMAVFGWIAIGLWAIIVADWMPAAYREGIGLTQFKIIVEWVIIALLMLALGHVVYRRSLIPQPSYWPLISGLLLTMATELLFTLYTGVSGTINLVGHLTKFMSSWLVLEALVSSTLTRPFEMVARATDSFEGIPDPVMLVNRHGLLVQVNTAAQNWFASTVEDLIGRPLVDSLCLEPTDPVTHRILQSLDLLTPVQGLEAMDVRRQRLVLFSMAPFWNGNDDAILVVCLRDITERRTMERALSVAKQRSEAALINSGQGLWDWNIKSGDVFFSPAMETMLGYEVGTWVRHVSAWERLIHPEDLPRVMRDLSDHLQGKAKGYDNTHRLRAADGAWVWVRDRGRVVEWAEDGSPLRAIGTHSDVSSAKAREDRLSSANADLQSFAYTISHDLKEPLRTISQHLHLLKMQCVDPVSPEIEEHLGQAIGGAHRLNSMIDGLLEYARIDGDPITPVAVDLNSLCHGVIRTLEHTLVDQNGKVFCSPLPTVMGDADLLGRVFQNLLSNALKYHAAGRPPRVNIAGWTEGDKAVIEVTDEGIGIEEDALAHIFDMFVRGAAKALYPGHGIGLAIVKRIMERLGGSVAVRSTLGQGATFRLVLPCPSGAVAALSQAALSPADNPIEQTVKAPMKEQAD